jgi:hypothetical protein
MQSILCWCVWQASGFSCREDFFTVDFLYEEIVCTRPTLYFQFDVP